MHRLLVKVREKRLRKRYRDRNGLEYARYALRVRVEGSAIDALKVPKDRVGRDVSLTRDFLLPWGVKVGDLLVLDPSESARVLCPRPPRALARCRRSGAATFESGDVDRDGLPEDLLTNAFVRAVVQPHRGARVQSLEDCRGVDRLAQPFDYIMAGKLILLGGAEEYIAEGGSPGDMWNAAFRRDEPVVGPDAVEITYSHAPESPEGVKYSKRVRVERDFPGVLESFTVAYAGKPKKAGERADDDGERAADGGEAAAAKRDEAKVTLCVRLVTPVHGDVGSQNVFDVPGPSGLAVVRYHRPGYGRRWRWRDWRDEHFGLKAGFVVSRHEGLGAAMAVLFSRRKIAHVSVRRDFTGPEVTVCHVRSRIPKGGRRRYGLALLVGHAAAATGDSLLLLTRGVAGAGGVPVAITLRTDKRLERPRAAVSTAAGRTSARLARRDLPGAGHVYSATLRVPRSALPLSCSVRAGRDRLSAVLEAT
jgi:hypothetical protein